MELHNQRKAPIELAWYQMQLMLEVKENGLQGLLHRIRKEFSADPA
jgi:uncharacterized protein (DUF3820 family)